jgi:hypothetical protein
VSSCRLNLGRGRAYENNHDLQILHLDFSKYTGYLNGSLPQARELSFALYTNKLPELSMVTMLRLRCWQIERGFWRWMSCGSTRPACPGCQWRDAAQILDLPDSRSSCNRYRMRRQPLRQPSTACFCRRGFCRRHYRAHMNIWNITKDTRSSKEERVVVPENFEAQALGKTAGAA